MKKSYIIALAAAAVATVAVTAQKQKMMHIHLSDGSVQTHLVSDVTKITFEDSDTPVTPGTYTQVDLGLSVPWATFNVGANAPEEFGNFYAYGEIEPKEEYTYATYKWAYWDYNDWDCDEWEKYLKLGATITGTPYDVAHMKCGDKWRMPTREEFNELIHNCTWTPTSLNGVSGILGTSNINGNTIFFPYAGNWYDDGRTHIGTNAFLWTATEFQQNDITVECRNYRACIDGQSQSADGYDYPEVGFNVRAVYGDVPSLPLETVDVPTGDDIVDLGLSVKWAGFNVGAKTPSGKGFYLCWGELEEKQYSHSYNYKYFDPYTETYINIGESICGTAYDPCTQYWGDGWRLPTKAEIEELINNCTWEQTSTGYTVTGPNGNSIFLPAYGTGSYKPYRTTGTESVNYPSGETPDADGGSCYALNASRTGYGATFKAPEIRTWSSRCGGTQMRGVHE